MKCEELTLEKVPGLLPWLSNIIFPVFQSKSALEKL